MYFQKIKLYMLEYIFYFEKNNLFKQKRKNKIWSNLIKFDQIWKPLFCLNICCFLFYFAINPKNKNITITYYLFQTK